MVKVGKWIARHRILVLLIGVLLIVVFYLYGCII